VSTSSFQDHLEPAKKKVRRSSKIENRKKKTNEKKRENEYAGRVQVEKNRICIQNRAFPSVPTTWQERRIFIFFDVTTTCSGQKQ
jgi:hypothetical protein